MTAQLRILIIGPSWVGDMVMAQCLFSTLKSQYPEAQIDVLAPQWSKPILERMPEISEAIVMPVGHGELALRIRWQLAQSLKQRKYAWAIVLPNSLKSTLIPFFAGIPRRTGWRGEMRFGLLNDIRLLDKQRYPLMIQRFAALAYTPGSVLPEHLPWPKLIVKKELSSSARIQFSLDTSRPVLALCPGAEFGPAKRWPEQHYATVADTMIKKGWQVWLFGSEKDRIITDKIQARLTEQAKPYCHNLAATTQLSEAIDLLSVADAVVCNDSGLMHIAASVGRPLVVVYGSTSPGFTPPLVAPVEVQSIPVDCGPCFQRVCPQGHMKCLVDISPERVLAALGRLPIPKVAR